MDKRDALEFNLVFEKSNKDGELYNEWIREVDSEGNQIGSDWVIFPHGSAFRLEKVEEFVLLKSVKKGWWEVESEQENDFVPTSVSKFSAKLKPYDVHAIPPEYALFGTNRVIEYLALIIEEGEIEGCNVVGAKGVDKDYLEIFLTLIPEHFRLFSSAIREDRTDDVYLELKGVPGFYSCWTPEIRTDTIKVLSDKNTHKVTLPNNLEENYLPLRCGEPIEFSIQWSSQSNYEKPDIYLEKEAEIEEIQLQREFEWDRYMGLVAAIERKFHDRLRHIEDLKQPLWIICALLFIGLGVQALTIV